MKLATNQNTAAEVDLMQSRSEAPEIDLEHSLSLDTEEGVALPETWVGSNFELRPQESILEHNLKLDTEETRPDK